jgi:tartrate/fumarate subfamily iron-sulfur-dependent hydro-lyase beta chain
LLASSLAGTLGLAAHAQVHINEILVHNPGRPNDPDAKLDMDGRSPGWVELRNNGGTPVDLTGWALSDEPGLPGKWVFAAPVAPATTPTTIGAGGYKLVFCGGLERNVANVEPHTHFKLDGSGPARFDPPPLSEWPQIAWNGPAGARRVNLDTLTAADTSQWKAGDALLLSGKLLTGRDAAHKRIADLVAKGEPLPVDFHNRFIYYVGPVDPIAGEAVGPAGPTTATRMDRFTDLMLGEQVGLLGMVGKAERGPAAIQSIKSHGAVYCIAVGGAAYLVAKAIQGSRVLAFPELGMEAVYEFDVRDMPVTVAVDSQGNSVHESGPREWRARIGRIPVMKH